MEFKYQIWDYIIYIFILSYFKTLILIVDLIQLLELLFYYHYPYYFI
jgi:hypothetical protein